MKAACMQALELRHYTLSTCLGLGCAAHWRMLANAQGNLKPCDFETVHLPTWIGEVAGVDDAKLPGKLARFDCRNNRLAQWALQQDDFSDNVQNAIAEFGAERIACYMGTSTSGILQTELAYRRRTQDKNGQLGALPADFHYAQTHNNYSIAAFVAAYLGLKGPTLSISSACSSSAKVFAHAARMMAAGWIDAALVGGVDSLCLTTLYGFHSLQLLSPEPARPYDAQRKGISIGEGAAFALLTRATQPIKKGGILLCGIGESSDAYHMSSPHPQGLGAQIAMHNALASAGLVAHDIGYINLHGTATISNDAAEAKAVHALFAKNTPCSSTKGATGHTLGASGAIEAVICAMALTHATVPAGIHTQQLDPALPVDYVLHNRPMKTPYALTNSFGFGGSNCSLVIGMAQ